MLGCLLSMGHRASIAVKISGLIEAMIPLYHPVVKSFFQNKNIFFAGVKKVKKMLTFLMRKGIIKGRNDTKKG